MDTTISGGTPTPQLAGESAAAYAMFLKYRDLGPHRTIAAVLRADAKPSEKKNRRQLEFWSGRFSWLERCRAHEAHAESIKQLARDAALAEHARRWELRRLESIEDAYSDGVKLRRKALAMLAHDLVVEETSEDGQTRIIKPARWTMKEAAIFLRLGAELRAAACEAVGIASPADQMNRLEEEATLDAILDLPPSGETPVDPAGAGEGGGPSPA